jgi:hypothetical protein
MCRGIFNIARIGVPLYELSRMVYEIFYPPRRRRRKARALPQLPQFALDIFFRPPEAAILFSFRGLACVKADVVKTSRCCESGKLPACT